MQRGAVHWDGVQCSAVWRYLPDVVLVETVLAVVVLVLSVVPVVVEADVVVPVVVLGVVAVVDVVVAGVVVDVVGPVQQACATRTDLLNDVSFDSTVRQATDGLTSC